MRRDEVEGFAAATIAGRDGELQATFVPGAGMVCCSLRHEGVELLARRHGVRAYAERGKTMGVPLLYPWANRLAGPGYPGPGGPVVLRGDDPLLTRDPSGLPIHGALPGALPWELLDAGADGAAGELRARLRWEREELLAIFPWRHELELRARVEGAALTIATTVRASAEAGAPGVPVSFGFHPYLSPPEGERSAWEVELPVGRRLLLDERMIPTGASEPFENRRFALADSAWDDAFAGLTAPQEFELTAGAMQIRLRLADGWSNAQLYAPAGERFVCFEPMTAPANALRSGDGLRHVAPGETFTASFAIALA
ncbi:MAG TPA: aldose 1-epimerase [Solirubrobacteraceae bacterium]|nr:aldose 1-epimerase [Solirubrobacteraceae bacterium]